MSDALVHVLKTDKMIPTLQIMAVFSNKNQQNIRRCSF